jgi:hypothetical protein
LNGTGEHKLRFDGEPTLPGKRIAMWDPLLRHLTLKVFSASSSERIEYEQSPRSSGWGRDRPWTRSTHAAIVRSADRRLRKAAFPGYRIYDVSPVEEHSHRFVDGGSFLKKRPRRSTWRALCCQPLFLLGRIELLY